MTDQTDALATYLRQISVYPLLSKKEETQIGQAITEVKKRQDYYGQRIREGTISQDEYEQEMRLWKKTLHLLRERMITSNLRLVVSVAKKVSAAGIAPGGSDQRGEHRPHQGGGAVRLY